MENATYEADFYAWTVEQANLLREGRFADADIANIVEEIETLGRSERRELRNRLLALLSHLLKWQVQPGGRGASWRSTINEQRESLREHLAENPTLAPTVPDLLPVVWPRAVKQAMIETLLAEANFPPICPWSVGLILDDGFFPQGER